MPRPSKKYDSEIAKKVQAMAQYGISQERIAGLVDLSIPTLRKLYMKELENGMALADFAVGKKLFERCMAGEITALIFWAKTRMGWREKDGAQDKGEGDNFQNKLIEAIRHAMKSVG